MSNLISMVELLGLVAVLAPAVYVLVAVSLSRVWFAGYVRRNYPTRWEQLVTQGSKEGRISLRIGFDATPEMGAFRADESADLGDTELLRRKKTVNTAEKMSAVVFIVSAIALILILSLAAFMSSA